MSQRPKTRRKIRLVDRKQQLRFALTLAVYALLYPVVFFFLALVPPLSYLLTDPAKVEPVVRLLVGFHVTHWWLGLITLMVIGFLSVQFSHRIFGPLYRFQQALEQKTADPLGPVQIRLRRGDYFKDHGEQLERFLNGDPAAAPPAREAAEGVGETTGVQVA